MAALPLRPISSASVLMPTWQGIEFLERVLDALAAQRADFYWDLHVIDSGSSDGTWEYLLARRASFPVPCFAIAIQQAEFDHGDTRNELASRSAGDLLVYLTQDAIPSTPDWLANLARNFADPIVGAAYCRNVARRDARRLTQVFCRSDPGYSATRAEVRLPEARTWSRMDADARRVLYNFNNVASAIRRELWERHPFPRTTMGEDVLIARGILEAGYTIVYDADATVDHSHDYGPEKMRWRGNVDGKFNVEWMQRRCIGAEADIAVLTERLVAEDMAVLDQIGASTSDLGALREEARVLRSAMVRGLYEGGLSRWRYARTEMRAHGRLRVLFVVEETGAQGASERVLELARAVRRRGHEVSVLSIDAAEEEAPFHVRREERDGTTVLRALAPDRPGVLEAAFESLLVCERPDLVHFANVHTASCELLRAARDLGLATVVDVDDDRAVREKDRTVMSAVAAVDLRLCSSVELRTAWITAASLDPQTIAFAAHGGVPGQAKSIHDEARELEFRYRALCSIVRSGEARLTHFSATGAEGRGRGKTARQESAWLLARPKSAVEFAIAGMPAGPMTLELEQFQIAAESTIVLAGRALIDDVDVGRFAPSRAGAHDDFVLRRIECWVPEGARVLRLEPQLPNGDRAFLRVCRVTFSSPRDSHASRAARTAPPADLARLAEELRVSPGAAIERRALPRVALVVPSFNGSAVLGECLKSVSALDYPSERLEVVLVDNGSSDGSLELVRREFPSVRIVAHEKNLGFAAACNAGAQSARDADVLAFLNNDMRFERDFLLELVAPLARRECAATTAKILGWDGRTIDTSGTGTTFVGIAVQPGFGEPPRPEHDVARKTLFACGGAMAIDARVLREVGGFDERYFAYYEDLDLGWRMWVLGHEIHYVPSALCYHHHSHTSKRFAPEVVRLVMIRNSLVTCIKNYDERNLARILPVMLALALRRAHLKSDLDEHAFRIEVARLVDVERQGSRRTVDEQRATVGDRVAIGKIGAADLIAINDVLANWSYWMRRRREVQSRRKRGDDEIQRLFLEPLACVEGDASYAALQAELVALFGLGETFARS
jgi:GT2 family glycosyltransferase